MAEQNRNPAALETSLYYVNSAGSPPRLVEASTLARARSFVGDDATYARLASQIDTYSAGCAGVEIEDAESDHPGRWLPGGAPGASAAAA